MQEVIIIATLLAVAGVVWGELQPLGLSGETLRQSLTSLVYILLLPALVIDVIWSAPLSVATLQVVALATLGVFTGALIAYMGYQLLPRRWRLAPAALGSVVLAAAFPNAPYLGLPVLESVLGSDARAIAIQYDLMACTPLLLTVGVLFAAHCGSGQLTTPLWRQLLKVPPLWALLVGMTLNLLDIPKTALPERLLSMLGNGVIPLMLISLGLSLRWQAGWLRDSKVVIPVVMIQLLITPAIIWFCAQLLHLDRFLFTAVVLEAAMPSMVLGLVIADRYRLDTHLYAIAVTLTMVVSLFTLPLWLTLIENRFL
ncbi:MAG: AEC family transporter [Gammaproteobacteria bacterium]|nr:AEC family transporter [Gammaproteobacteria bacterium]